jgi:heme A synthase
LIAALTGIYLYAFVGYLRRKYAEEAVQQYTLWLLVLFGAQILLGFVNLILLAPVWMQLIHLLVADLVWIRFVLLADLFLSGRLTAQDLAHAPVQEAVQ